MRAYSFFVIYALLFSADICLGGSIVDKGETATLLLPETAGLFVSLAVLVLIITVLIGCAEICKKGNSGFQDLPDETIPRPGNDLVIFPPIESTPDSQMTGPPIIEPLPDLASIKKPSISNSMSLRPKIALLNEPDARQERNSMQEKIKLQSIISRNQLPREKLNYIKEIGNGWFGNVLQGDGKDLLPGYRKSKVVVLKLNEEADPHDQLNFLLEASAYREVQHENVIKLHGQCVETTPFLLVLEYCTFGDLKQYLVGHKVAFESISEKGLLLRFACDIAAGLKALHEAKFIHRDIAIRNCLLSSDLTCKVGDYFINENIYNDEYYTDSNGDNIPIRWIAPETVKVENKFIKLNSPTETANVWSYGIVLWEIMTFGSLPYAGLEDDFLIKHVLKDKELLLSKPDLPIRYIDKMFELVGLCCSIDPNSRPSLRELRIMLLQLLSYYTKVNDVNKDAFEEKWNKLLPKKPAQSVDVRNMDENGAIPNKPIDLDLADVHLTNKYPTSAKPLEASPINELCLQDEFSSLQHRKRHSTSSSDSDVIVLDERNSIVPNSTSTPAPKEFKDQRSIIKNDSASDTFHTALTSQTSQSSELESFSSKLDSSKFAAMLDTVGPLSLDVSSETVSEEDDDEEFSVEASVETIKNDGFEALAEKRVEQPANKAIDESDKSKIEEEKKEVKTESKNTDVEKATGEEKKQENNKEKDAGNAIATGDDKHKDSSAIVTDNYDNKKTDEKPIENNDKETSKVIEAVAEHLTSNDTENNTSTDKKAEEENKSDNNIIDLDQESENEENKNTVKNEIKK
ncbi:DgyrCDS5110 [Dimorphilus gyrociliatus]|uniref:non-specific serine/threonine protein kinase n=1 Tax=Dimorphilus gyrociliatus TaxID=2664684 RepID=A0A7I8VJ05_9ANNE|nr:DgyrCDS5110 [Dimorphilus gyrociliatus]